MKFRIAAYFFFIVGFLDLVSKMFFGGLWEIGRDNFEFLGPVSVFTPILFISIGGIFLKESRIQLSFANYGTTRYKYYSPQFIILLLAILIFGFFTFNAQINMDNRGIEFGFGFLTQESSFDVQFSLIDYDGSHSYARAYLVGLLNTLLVAFIGIIFSTRIVALLFGNILLRAM